MTRGGVDDPWLTYLPTGRVVSATVYFSLNRTLTHIFIDVGEGLAPGEFLSFLVLLFVPET